MFAKHLMAGAGRPTGPKWVNSTIGTYPSYTTYDVDLANRIYYRNGASAPPLSGYGPVGQDGSVLLFNRDSKKIYLYGTGPSGPGGNALATYAMPDPSQWYLWQLYGRSAAVIPQAQYQAVIAGQASTYSISHLDLASGQAYAMGSFPALVPFNTGTDLYVKTGSYFGFQGASLSWYNILQASNGRNKRATIPLQIYENAGTSLFVRFQAGSGPQPVQLVPWRRPLTTATRVRAFQALQSPFQRIDSTSIVRSAWSVTRRGRAIGFLQLTVFEVEIGASTGVSTLNGQRVSQHQMTVYPSIIYGVASIGSPTDVQFIQTGRGDVSQTLNLLQYLAADGTPTGEFVSAASGQWDFVQNTVVVSGNRPYLVTVNNILTVGNSSKESPAVLDLAGNYVRGWLMPPATNGYSYQGALMALPNDDLILGEINQYGTGWASADLGTSWFQMTGWGPRGSQPQSGVIRGPNTPSENTELMTQNPLFYT